jgi:hypothetical protein
MSSRWSLSPSLTSRVRARVSHDPFLLRLTGRAAGPPAPAPPIGLPRIAGRSGILRASMLPCQEI